MLRKGDLDLGWSDFAAIFPVSECAGGYDEQLYFVPVAFEHLAREPMDGREYISGFVRFFVRNFGALERDRLSDAAHQAFETLFSKWTSTFTVVHYDHAACVAKGWRIGHLDVVSNSEAVTEFLALLVRDTVFAETAERAVRKLIASEASDANVAWFLEIARSMQEAAIYVPETLQAQSVRFTDIAVAAKRVQELLTTPAILQRQYRRVQASIVEREPSPTYWSDVLSTLGLAA